MSIGGGVAANVPWNGAPERAAGIARFPCHMRPQERSCAIEYPTGRRTPPRSWRCIWRSCRSRRASMLCAAVVLAACCRVRAFALVVLTDVVPGRVALTIGEEIIFPLFRKYALW